MTTQSILRWLLLMAAATLALYFQIGTWTMRNVLIVMGLLGRFRGKRGMAAGTAALRAVVEFTKVTKASYSEDDDNSSDSSDDMHSLQATPTNSDGKEATTTSLSFGRQVAEVPIGRVRFETEATETLVPSLRDLDDELKADLWWQPKDYTKIHHTRSLISGLYKEATKAGAVGTDSDDFSFEPALALKPAIAEESCIGLNLGREQERFEGRKRYFEIVLTAQAQKLPEDEVARHARRHSKKDRRLAEVRAAKQHMLDMDV
uniref:Uncharacterized protein n=1 Tax=Pyrodinium bahamense TaxID=73915 RepID=A0A7S0FYM2_9DINO